MVKSTKEIRDWVVGGCPTNYADLRSQGYTFEPSFDFEGWEIYDKKGHHVDNLYFDENVPFFEGWPKDWNDIADPDTVVEAMVEWHAHNRTPIKHGILG